MRINKKKILINYENSIQKSNEFSFSRLNKKLSLNQLQLLAYAIYCTQKNGTTEFNKYEFEKKFNLTKYNTKDAYEDSKKILELQISLLDLEKDKFKIWNVFTGMDYDNGLFIFEWHKSILPHILDLQERYLTIDLTITEKFRSEFSWILYDYLKSLYGYFHKPLSKEELMELFKVEGRKTYQQHTGKFKQSVLDVAIKEINEHTELEVSYAEEKKGRRIIGFDLRWSTGSKVESATKKQQKELKVVTDVILNDLDMYISVKDKNDNIRAKQIIRNIEVMKIHTEGTISITKKYASELIEKANLYLLELNTMLERDGKQGRKEIYYNWLEEGS